MVTRKSTSFLDEIFRLSPNPIFVVKAGDGTYVDVNDAFTKYFGLRKKEVIGKTPLKLGLITSKERLAYLKELKEKGYAKSIAVKLRTKNNRIRNMLFNTKLIKMKNQFFYLSIGMDISDLALIEKARQADIFIKSFNSMKETGVILISNNEHSEPSLVFANTEAKIILKFHPLKKILGMFAGQEAIFLQTPVAFHYVRNIPTYEDSPLKIILLKRVADGTCMTQKLKEFNLTSRQLEIASLAAHGHSNGEIAKNLCISEYTVKDHLKNIFKIIGIRKRSDLFLKLLSLG